MCLKELWIILHKNLLLKFSKIQKIAHHIQVVLGHPTLGAKIITIKNLIFVHRHTSPTLLYTRKQKKRQTFSLQRWKVDEEDDETEEFLTSEAKARKQAAAFITGAGGASDQTDTIFSQPSICLRHLHHLHQQSSLDFSVQQQEHQVAISLVVNDWLIMALLHSFLRFSFAIAHWVRVAQKCN